MLTAVWPMFKLAHQVLTPPHRRVAATAPKIGVAVRHKHRFIEFLWAGNQNLVRHAVSKIGGGDLPRFGVLDDEGNSAGGLPVPCAQRRA